MVWLPDFRSRSKSRPFATHPLFDLPKSRIVGISDPYCIRIPLWTFTRLKNEGKIILLCMGEEEDGRKKKGKEGGTVGQILYISAMNILRT